MKKKQNSQGTPSLSEPTQLRQDLVTGDWVVIATNRGRRPDEFKATSPASLSSDQQSCIFCDPVASAQEEDVLIYTTADGEWSLRIFPNKYPAFSNPKAGKIHHQEHGPYYWMDGVGFHEVIVTRDHHRHIGIMDPLRVAEILDAFQTRYVDLMNKKAVRYIEIFHNHGKEAGASIAHPHSQLAAIPVISPYLQSELDGAARYHRANRQCVYCSMVEWEQNHQERIVLENDQFIAFCPFASRAAFEVWVMPKKHNPYFERISDQEKVTAGHVLQHAIGSMTAALGDPAYNFYLHTAPCDGQDYPHYHWHIEILPKTSIWAGFELSTGIEVSTILPETAAAYLREHLT